MTGAGLALALALVGSVLPGAAQGRPIAPGDGSKPFCVAIKLDPWGDYDGPCRFGAPLGPMQAVVPVLNLGSVDGKLRAGGLPARFRDRLLNELRAINRLSRERAQHRLKRDARHGKKSWTARAAVNCALFGALGAGLTLLYDLVFKQSIDPRSIAENAATGCTLAVLAPALDRWVKRRGYDMEA